jgi:hypothetical protein
MTANEIRGMSYGALARALESSGTELTLEVRPTVTPPSGSREPAQPATRTVTVKGAEAAALLKHRGARLVAIDGVPCGG